MFDLFIKLRVQLLSISRGIHLFSYVEFCLLCIVEILKTVYYNSYSVLLKSLISTKRKNCCYLWKEISIQHSVLGRTLTLFVIIILYNSRLRTYARGSSLPSLHWPNHFFINYSFSLTRKVLYTLSIPFYGLKIWQRNKNLFVFDGWI